MTTLNSHSAALRSALLLFACASLSSVSITAQRVIPLGAGRQASSIAIDSFGRPVLAGNGPSATQFIIQSNNSVTAISLPPLPSGGTVSASAISRDGKVIGGTSTPASSTMSEGILWGSSLQQSPTGIGTQLFPWAAISQVAVTPQSEVVAIGYGGASRTSPKTPFFWTATRGIVPLTGPGGGSSVVGSIAALSADGSVAAGIVHTSTSFLPVVWYLRSNQSKGTALDIAGGTGGAIGGVSPNGKSFCGVRYTAGNTGSPAVWLDSDGQMQRQLLSPPTVTFIAGGGSTIADDGATVGNYFDINFARGAFFWHPSFPNNEVHLLNDYFRTHSVAIAQGVKRVHDFIASSGLYHFVVQDNNGDYFYVSTPDFGPSTNTNPAFTHYGSPTGVGGSTPAIKTLGPATPGSTLRVSVSGLNPGVLGNVSALLFSLGREPNPPGLFGLYISLSGLVGSVQVPVIQAGSNGSGGALFELALPGSMTTGQSFHCQAVAIDKSGQIVLTSAFQTSIQ